MQLIPQDEDKRWLIYKVCLGVACISAVLTAALFLVVVLFPHDQNKQTLFGMPCFVSWIAMLIAFAVMRRLYLTKHFTASSYSLPYRLRKDKFILYFFIGCTIALSAMMISKATSNYAPSLATPLLEVFTKNNSKLFAVPVWALAPIIICALMTFLYLLISWQGTILYHDHLHWYGFGSRKDIFYSEIQKVSIESRPTGSAGGGYNYILRLFTEHKPPLEINLTPFTASSVIVMLNVIHQFAPNAVINELAEQMRRGDFPIMSNSARNPFNQESRK
jgi:hypothetical protein